MPEGHTIGRRGYSAGGSQVRFSKSTRRRADSLILTAELNGRRLEGVGALDKHLFHRWEGDLRCYPSRLVWKIQSVHRRGKAPTPSDGTRMRWLGHNGAMYLSTACEIISADQEEELRNRIGPDPLAVRKGDLDRVMSSLSRRSAPIAKCCLIKPWWPESAMSTAQSSVSWLESTPDDPPVK